MKPVPFLLRKRQAALLEGQDAHSPYARLLQSTMVAEDALELLEQTRYRGYRLAPCPFDVEKFDPRDICAGCPGLHTCTRRSARQTAALDALLEAQLNACYLLLCDMRAALDFRENNAQRLYARLNVDIGLYADGAAQKEALNNAADAYEKLFTVTGEPRYQAYSRACTRILAGDREEAQAFLQQNGAFD